MPKIPVKIVSWDEIIKLSMKLSEKMKNDDYIPDVIIAIARGGLVPSRLVADMLGVIDILSIKIEHWVETASHTPQAKIKYPYKVNLDGKKVAIIDDITDTGDSIELAKKYVIENFTPSEIKTATLQYIKPVAKIVPDYYAEEIVEWAWFMYPWNYWEDEINLINKILAERFTTNINELKSLFKQNYGVEEPPIPIEDIIKEMKRRKMIK
ncbi:phosphoribosyltransferase [Sulfolobus sp. A20]|uniref:phosphoribosyltransferase n=1 Tax=Sulfolobaceae TaxID=118883 RepID=UPI000845BE3C|nr:MULTISPECIES: phosphoribosyltransferase [unclassified Sulfolobus]TRM77524.1 phosphoribosyltransferase [Sulfolobus sp. A20-N-F8]TRM79338.1 phosphoribosyltransferase [Sulfolobus sp. B5]TRM80643.1 phosphoribosyltransferase [Sulfolobus sp. D5]TRM89412.1 phosphoribosyltransferase [Sulfolobus sp. C3]TRM99818.1 phosphoribosyltransferase [Sulfolobus sp. E1]TRN00355.1 phosphoribosyltransferase [Sulfolobus sp. F1]